MERDQISQISSNNHCWFRSKDALNVLKILRTESLFVTRTHMEDSYGSSDSTSLFRKIKYVQAHGRGPRHYRDVVLW
jgi:hypothetical protein